MTLTVGTNTYVTLSEANTYFDSRPFSSSWTQANDDVLKEGALIMACKQLDLSYGFIGEPADEDQVLSWPRLNYTTKNGALISTATTPQAIKEAQMELAYQWVQADQLTPSGTAWTSADGTAAKGALQREKLGDLERWYHQPQGSMFSSYGGYAAIRKQYPLIDLLVKPFIVSSTTSVFKEIIQ